MKAIFYEDNLEKYYFGHQAEEIYKQKIYQSFLKPGMNIYDIGGNIGLFTTYAQPFAKKLTVLEPSKEHADCIVKMIEFNGFKNVELKRVALAQDTGKTKFYHNNNVTMYSMEQVVSDNEGYEEVETVSFDELLKDEESVDFMKLDVEGSEAKIIGSKGFREACYKVKQMIVEFHAWSGVGINLQLTTLKDRGFSLQQIPNDATLFYCRR